MNRVNLFPESADSVGGIKRYYLDEHPYLSDPWDYSYTSLARRA
jgi:hypothetical protein